MPDNLEISVLVGTTKYRWTDEAKNVRFSNGDGGFLTFSGLLPRDINAEYADLRRLSEVFVYHGTDVIWHGRVDALPRRAEGIGVEALGFSSSLQDGMVPGYSYTSQKASDIIKIILTNYCPDISSDQGNIDTSSYTIPALAKTTRVRPLSVIQEALKFETWDKAVWEDKKFWYKAYDASALSYDCSINDIEASDEGETLEGTGNKIFVEYKDGSGNPLWEERTDSDTTNIWNQWGKIRYLDNLKVETTSQAAAQQAGDKALEVARRPRWKGPVAVKDCVYHPTTGQPIPYFAIRAMRNLRIRDYRGGNRILKIIKVDVDLDNRQATLALDQSPGTIEAMLAQAIT